MFVDIVCNIRIYYRKNISQKIAIITMTPGGPAHQEELDARPPEIESSEVDFFELRLAPPEVVPVAVLLVRAGVEEVHVAAGNDSELKAGANRTIVSYNASLLKF
jgi:hypothetical protein